MSPWGSGGRGPERRWPWSGRRASERARSGAPDDGAGARQEDPVGAKAGSGESAPGARPAPGDPEGTGASGRGRRPAVGLSPSTGGDDGARNAQQARQPGMERRHRRIIPARPIIAEDARAS
ncbi:hypothetical protein CHIBA101_0441 [Actinomyces sp. Chiba101]|nr:hypothetical protein CHIBA101_0441 [Actinomyces sp. Chiba101]GAV94753.1 hypothetical protein ADENT20671_1523 [Actinomyces denticolens]